MKNGRKSKPSHQASEFGLDVLGSDDDLYRWFLLCFLLGKPIQSAVAVKTWQLFLRHKLDTPWAIIKESEFKLSRILVAGKYTRYNHVMARALKKVNQQLIDMYEGSLLLMLDSSENEDEFGRRLQELYGVGPKTAEIIMRETEEFFARRVE